MCYVIHFFFHHGDDIIQNEIVRHVISPKHVPATMQLADIFIKAFGCKEFDAFLLELNICYILHLEKGGGRD